MEAQPLRTVQPADSGEGGKKSSWDEAWRMMVGGKDGSVKEGSGSPSINLGLGIGAGPVIKRGKPGFTPTQLKELTQQALIFKYISAGLPVPLHLVLSIWKSVASSFAPANGGIYKQYPSFVGFSPQGFDYRNMMDSEPGRCRRTDGKKWRCSKDVVLDQKYCVRHMHRGRQRSRKHVEASEIASPSDTTPSVDNNNSENSNTNLSISVPIGLQLRSPSSNAEINNAPTISTSGNNESNINVGDNKDSITTPTVKTITNSKNHGDVAGDGNGWNLVNDYNSVNRSSNNGNSNIVINTVSRGFGFSPKSVLQVLGCYFDYRCNEDSEPGRCRRTDGKKWRCGKNIVPDQKYCERHMHRGAKRQVEASQPSVATNSTCLPTTTTTTIKLTKQISL